MIILVVLAIIAVVVIFSIFAIKEEEFTMNKLRNIYLYLVSFVTLMMILGGLIFTVQNATDVLFPTNYNEIYYAEKEGALSAEQEKINAENQQRNEENRRTDSKKSVAKSIAVVVVALPAFVYHWKKIESEKKELKEQKDQA